MPYFVQVLTHFWFYISYGCSFIHGTGAFRAPWALQMIPAILLFFGMIFLPESPRWLASKDRWEETRAVLTLTHGHGDPDSPFVIREFDEIREWIKIESEANNASYLELLRPRMLNRTIIGVFMQIWSQLTGMNVMVGYEIWNKFPKLPKHPLTPPPCSYTTILLTPDA